MAEVNGIGAVGAGAGISPAAAAVNTRPQRVQQSPDTTKAAEQSREQASAKEAGEKRKERLEDVIATSKDGDTVQATKTAIEQLKEDEEEGRVVPKDSLMAAKETTAAINPAKERIEEEQKEKEEKEEEEEEQQQITSFAGYTDAQLKQLYVKGDISKQDYDKEIESREEERTQQGEKAEAFQKEEAQNIADMNENERDEQKMKNLGSPDSSDAPDAMMRARILQSLDANAIFNQDQN
ncbi:MAG: hypothetical protein IK115_14075 [Lachnospiraceae bacterium]|nr:hypothetical protein [Lachnospiraceae bacterium]